MSNVLTKFDVPNSMKCNNYKKTVGTTDLTVADGWFAKSRVDGGSDFLTAFSYYPTAYFSALLIGDLSAQLL